MAVLQDYQVPSMPAGDGNSQALDTGVLAPGFVVYLGTGASPGTWTGQVQVSEDKQNWHNVGVSTMVPGRVQVSEPAKHLRVVVSGHSAGTPDAKVVGHSS